MRIIALEEHFITPREQQNLPPGAQRGSDREKLLGFDIVAELLNLGDTRLAAMDAAGIELQVLSHNQPGCQALDATTAIPLAREVNDLLAAAVNAHPNRFAGLAALPTADPAAAVRELDRAVTRLGFKGAMINGHTQGAFLDDKRFWGIFECAQALGVPIYLHPSKPHPAVMGAYFAGYEELALAAWGFGIDTGAHFLRLVFAGVFDAFPNLTFILGHLGEGLPFMLHRINDQTRLAATRRGLKKTPAQYLTKNLVVTCSGNFSDAAFRCTVMALGVDNVLFSVDWPYESNAAAWSSSSDSRSPRTRWKRSRTETPNAFYVFDASSRLPGLTCGATISITEYDRQTSRSIGDPVDQVRVRHQPAVCQSTWPHGPAGAAADEAIE
jgi:predicted TIM-barrel fold metal-dependent hydrolase